MPVEKRRSANLIFCPGSQTLVLIEELVIFQVPARQPDFSGSTLAPAARRIDDAVAGISSPTDIRSQGAVAWTELLHKVDETLRAVGEERECRVVVSEP